MRHSAQQERALGFAASALRAGAGDDIAALTTAGSKRRFRLSGSNLRLIVIFVIVLSLAGVIGVLSQRSVEVAAVPPCESDVSEGASQDPGSQSTASGASGGTSAEEADAGSGQPSSIVVYVSGAVNSPGVVTVSGQSRINDALQAAGGSTDDAELAAVNLAQRIEDGQHIHIPAVGEEPPADAGGGGGSEVSGSSVGAGAEGGNSGAVNINTADLAQLQTIPGVGPVTAQAILSWREANGKFETVDQLIEVKGIGSKTLESLRPYVRV